MKSIYVLISKYQNDVTLIHCAISAKNTETIEALKNTLRDMYNHAYETDNELEVAVNNIAKELFKNNIYFDGIKELELTMIPLDNTL